MNDDEFILRRVKAIAEDETMLAGGKAIECLRALDVLPQKDIARPDYRTAAETFALLAIADALMTRSGHGLADALARGIRI